jgi:DNA mismatch repair protein MutS
MWRPRAVARASAQASRDRRGPSGAPARSLAAEVEDLSDLRDRIESALVAEPPALARDGGVIRDGHDAALDDLRIVSRGGKAAIAAMEEAERARTGIGSLKIRYNRVFGYYIEVSNSNLGNVPADYIRKQTIAGGERFITPDSRNTRQGARRGRADRRPRGRAVREAAQGRFRQRPRGARYGASRGRARRPGALADAAAAHNYTKPQMHDGDEYAAIDVRHPVVELTVKDAFVPNDVQLDASASQLMILTGPEHGRQVDVSPAGGAARLMAQTGSFVPARQAKLSVVDRIFARVGASDNIARGSRPSWSRCRRPRPSCTRPRLEAWSSSTRSAAAPRPSTG